MTLAEYLGTTDKCLEKAIDLYWNDCATMGGLLDRLIWFYVGSRKRV